MICLPGRRRAEFISGCLASGMLKLVQHGLVFIISWMPVVALWVSLYALLLQYYKITATGYAIAKPAVTAIIYNQKEQIGNPSALFGIVILYQLILYPWPRRRPQ